MADDTNTPPGAGGAPKNPGNTPQQGGDADLASALDADTQALLEAAQRAVNDINKQSAAAPAMTQEELETLRAAGLSVEDIAAEAASGGALAAAGPATVAPKPAPPQAKPFTPPIFEGTSDSGQPATLSLLDDVNVHVRIELGRTRMLIEDVLKLNEGAVVELDKLAGDPVDVFVNDRHVARGEVLVLNDSFCVRISEIMGTDSITGERSA